MAVCFNEDKDFFTFYWKIKHFSLFSMFKDEIESPVFRVEEMHNTEWRLILNPGRQLEDEVFLDICRENDVAPQITIYVDVKVFLLKTNGEKVIKEVKHLRFTSGQKLGEQLRQKRRQIYENEYLFLPDDTLTVGCFIKESSKTISESMECTAYAEMSFEKFSFAIPFDVTLQKHLQKSFSISKVSVSKKYPNFKIILDPICSNHNTELKTVQIVMNKPSVEVSCKCKLSVESTKNKTVFSFDGWKKFSANTTDLLWNLTNSISSTESKDSSFILRCELVVSDGTYLSRIENINYPITNFQPKLMDFSMSSSKQSHMQKLKCLLEDNSLCDFTLQVEGKDFPIHKAVLGAVSPVFCAMFKQEMKEKENSISVIEDIDAGTIRKIIDFAYTESVENLEWERGIKLYSAADKYEILELQQCCVNWITAHLTIENIAEVLTISDMHHDKNLEKAANDFIFDHAKEIFRSENWKEFVGTNVTIANRIMQEMCLKLTS